MRKPCKHRQTNGIKNSRFWGRFAIRSNLSQTEVTDDPCKYWQLVTDPQKEIQTVDMVSEKIAHITYNVAEDFVVENRTSNIFIAIWTTSLARLHLYSYMEKIAEAPGCKLLYTDTDSCIFTNPRGQLPIASGEILGCMKNEYPKHTIMVGLQLFDRKYTHCNFRSLYAAVLSSTR